MKLTSFILSSETISTAYNLFFVLDTQKKTPKKVKNQEGWQDCMYGKDVLSGMKKVLSKDIPTNE